MDSLVRKALNLPSKPVVVLVNLWIEKDCPVPRYLLHSYYYSVPLINVCPAVTLCFGYKVLPKQISDQYSKTGDSLMMIDFYCSPCLSSYSFVDGVHPWGPKGVLFLGELLYAWWRRLEKLLTQDTTMDFDGSYTTHTRSFDQFLLPPSSSDSNISSSLSVKDLLPPIYTNNPIGLCTRCDALTDDADGKLVPISQPKGFRMVTRAKVGYGGFASTGEKNPTAIKGATKSFKKSWHADIPGSEITFRFYGSSVKIAIWQRRDGMGILNAYLDGNTEKYVKASGFFKGYTWAMERNNTGRSEIIPLYEGLTDDFHTLRLVVSDQPANPWVKGYLTQIFALLSASDNLECKVKI
jgi:hypothetical protein